MRTTRGCIPTYQIVEMVTMSNTTVPTIGAVRVVVVVVIIHGSAIFSVRAAGAHCHRLARARVDIVYTCEHTCICIKNIIDAGRGREKGEASQER